MQTYNDIFIEELIRRERPGGETMFKVGIVLLGIVLILAAFLFLYVIFSFLFTIVVILEILAFHYTVLEYEYSFTNGDLDIDKIMGKRKRKRAASFTNRDIAVMAPCPKGYTPAGSYAKTLDASRSKRENRWYIVVRAEDGQETLIYFSPSDRLIDGMSRYLSNRLQSADGKPRIQRSRSSEAE